MAKSSYGKRVAKEACKFCGEEFAVTGLANHEKRCPENPDRDDNSSVDEQDDDETTEADDEEFEGEEAIEEPATVAVESKTIKAVGKLTTSFYHFTEYIEIVAGQKVELPREVFNFLSAKGYVEADL